MNSGHYIVIAGPPGAGKTTQINELQRRLATADLAVKITTEIKPALQTPENVKRLVNDPSYPMNTPAEVTVYNDLNVKELSVIGQARSNGVICLTDASPLQVLVEHYYGYGTVGDYEVINRIIRFASDDVQPDLTIVLDAPTSVLTGRLKSSDIAYLERLRAGYLWEAKQRHLPVVSAVDDPASVSEHIWQLVSKQLARRRPSQPTAVKDVIESMQTAVLSSDTPLVTNPSGSVYALKTEPHVSAAALEQLSAGADDLRQVTLPNLHKRQLEQAIDNYVVAENVSLLSISSMHHSLPFDYQQRPLALLDYHKKDAQGRYRYLIPKNFDKKTKARYKQTMDTIFELYGGLLQALTAHSDNHAAFQVAQAVLPLAATSDIGWQLPKAALTTTLSTLAVSQLREMQDVSKYLAGELNHTAAPETQAQDQASFAAAVMIQLTNQYSGQPARPVTLVSHWPRNELDLLPYIVYEYSTQSLAEVRQEVTNWSYAKKSDLLQAYFAAQKPPDQASALQNIHYNWDMLTDFASYYDLQQAGLLPKTSRQALTPRNGYDVPPAIEDAGLSDDFERCFDLSLELHSQLQAAGYLLEAEYATLLGHRVRWTLACNASQFAIIMSHISRAAVGSQVKNIVKHMQDTLHEVHPLLAVLLKTNP